MPDIVNMMMFVEYGKSYPKKINMKGIVNSKTLLGYGEYTSRNSSRDNVQKDIDSARLEFSDGYLGYASRNSSRDNGEVKTYTNTGWITTNDERLMFKSEVKKYFSNDGDLAWMPVTSFKDYFTAEQYGLLREEDYAVVFQKVLPKFFQKVNLDPKNMMWWFDYHTNKGHPHTHLVFLEKDKTRRKGTFTQKDMNYFKGMIISEAEKRMDLLKGITVDNSGILRQKNLLRRELKDAALSRSILFQDNRINKKIAMLFKKMDSELDGGRLQLGSYNMRKYRKVVDSLAEDILNHPEVIDKKEEFMKALKAIGLSTREKLGNNYSIIEDIEIKKLKKEIGNKILSMKKDFQLKEFYDSNDFSKVIKKEKISLKNIQYSRGNAINFAVGRLNEKVASLKKIQEREDIEKYLNGEGDQYDY